MTSDTITVTGKWDKDRQTLMVQDLKLAAKQNVSIEPVYSVKENITLKTLRKFISFKHCHDYDIKLKIHFQSACTRV